MEDRVIFYAMKQPICNTNREYLNVTASFQFQTSTYGVTSSYPLVLNDRIFAFFSLITLTLFYFPIKMDKFFFSFC